MKSNDRRSDLFSGQASKQYSSIGRHLLSTNILHSFIHIRLLTYLVKTQELMRATDRTFCPLALLSETYLGVRVALKPT